MHTIGQVIIMANPFSNSTESIDSMQVLMVAIEATNTQIHVPAIQKNTASITITVITVITSNRMHIA